MKKLVLTSLCTLGAAGAVLAQGTIKYVAWSPAYSMQTNTTVVSPLFTGTVNGGAIGKTVAGNGVNGSFYYEVLVNAANTPSVSSLGSLGAWTDTGLGGINNTVVGQILAIGTSTDRKSVV